MRNGLPWLKAGSTGKAMQEGKKPLQSKKLNQLACEELAKNQNNKPRTQRFISAVESVGLCRKPDANEVLRTSRAVRVKPTDLQFEAIKAGVQYQEQRLPTIKVWAEEGLANTQTGSKQQELPA